MKIRRVCIAIIALIVCGCGCSAQQTGTSASASATAQTDSAAEATKSPNASFPQGTPSGTAAGWPTGGRTNGQSTASATSELVQSQSAPPVQDAFNPIARFIITTDIHYPVKLEKLMTQAYAYAEKQTYKNLDALLIAGDINQDTDEQGIQSYKQVISNKVKEDTQIITCMGNHEFMEDTENWETVGIKYYTQEKSVQMYKEMTGEEPNVHKVINGIHIIAWSPTISSSNVISYADNISWLKEQLEIAAADSKTNPILVMQHYPVRNTSYITGSTAMTNISLNEADKLFKQYPQIINLTGHSHNPLAFTTAIVQTDYTSINCGVGYGYGAAIDFMGSMLNTEGAQQMLIAEIDASGETRLIVWDNQSNTAFYDQPWTITPSKPSSFKYTVEGRRSSTKAPAFPDNAKASAADVTSNSVQLSFPSASCGAELMQNDVYYYEIQIFKNGKPSERRYMFANSHIKNRKAVYSCTISGLASQTDYSFRVYAVDAYYRKSSIYLEVSAATK